MLLLDRCARLSSEIIPEGLTEEANYKLTQLFGILKESQMIRTFENEKLRNTLIEEFVSFDNPIGTIST